MPVLHTPGSIMAWRRTALFYVTLAVVFSLASVSRVSGQSDRPTLKVSLEAFPSAGLDSPDTSPVNGAPNFEQTLQIRVRMLSMGFSAPVYRASARTALAAYFGYTRYDLDFEQWDDAQAGRPIKSLQSFEAGVSLRRRLENGWLMRMEAIPGLYSDFQGDIGFDDLRLRGELIFQRTVSEALTVGLGAGYSPSYGRGLPLPRLAIHWMAAQDVKMELMLPARAGIWYVPSPTVAFGVLANIVGGAHRGDPELYQVGDPETRLAAGTFGPSLLIRASQNLRIRIDSGVSFFRRLDLHDGSQELWSLDPERTAFARMDLELWR